jgi:hypothetical protein
MPHRKGPRRALLGGAIALPIAALALVPATTSYAHSISLSAATVKAPAAKSSYYISTLSTATAHARGLSAGKADAKSGTNRLAIIDFGGQLSSGKGSLLINHTTAKNGQIEAVAEQFAAGYSAGTKSKHASLKLGIGTNNSISANRGLGQTWAHLVATANAWAHKHAPRTTLVGANDLEPGFGSASSAEAWANGYSSVKGSGYLNYGSADGCPQASASGGGCNNGWTQQTVWYVSTGVRGASVTPEIYYSANAKQWALISKYGKTHHRKPLSIPGALDQHPYGGNTSAQAWSELRAQLSHDGVSASLSYALEIKGE